jgi:hemerythrin-like domain-containing protein
MGIQIGAKPDSGFDDPIGMLSDCHRRIEHFLNILCVVAERAQGAAMNEEESAAVEAALQYFRVGGQRHNADEEDSVFPRLRASAQPEDLSEIESLESDHKEAGTLHETVERLYRDWNAAKSLSGADHAALLSATERLRRLYTEHIRMEEQVVFPRASRLLSRAAIDAIGEEFRARRG